MDLDGKISPLGSVQARGKEAVEVLKTSGFYTATFTHNGITLVVYEDSTEREIAYQYEWKRACK